MAQDISVAVGLRIRALRAERAMSLSALAAEARVGKATLSEIEAGRRNPTLETLYALAGPLGTSLTTLLEDRVGTAVESAGVRATLLDVRRLSEVTVEVYRLELAAGADRESGGHGPGVVEHLLLSRGEAVVGPLKRLRPDSSDGEADEAGEADDEAGGPGEAGSGAGAETVLRSGDAATWRSDVEHRYRSEAGAEGILVITTPAREGRRQGVEAGAS